ncbi:glycosyltransferase [Diaphorobacter aerolatus]|uniref:N-acetylglucosaminyltransferase n=1 Tax=Diaphorobacter aerolatus TaxID=1288495 RepID=A0A7H0GHX9_9BURK|nr:glycosyltransferase [Diaphorobacter aerolatus]QNP47895.1 glycosyltransferase family 2 protein [Diaphorobacter aerolatus]
MIEVQRQLWHLVPLMLLCYFFTGGLLLRLITKAAKPLKDYTHQPRVSILLPVYNEGMHVLETINSVLNADWPTDKLEIVAIDDCSVDDSYDYLLKAQSKHPHHIQVLRNSVNSGKHISIINALARSNGEIVICIDSDCIFDTKVIRELVACFCDPKVGAVGGHIGILNVNENIFTLCQTLVYFMTFQVGKMIQNVHGRVFCISGCLFAMRREVFLSVASQVRARNWFGMKVRDGEDRFMTHMILMRGWKTLINPAAICWTSAPTRFNELFGQQLRWRRSAMRDTFWTLMRLPQHFQIMGVRAAAVAIIPELLIIIWALYLITAIPMAGLGHTLDVLAISFLMFCSFFVVTALVYNRSIQTIATGSVPIKYPIKALLGEHGS